MIRTALFKDIKELKRVCMEAHDLSDSHRVKVRNTVLERSLQVLVNSPEHIVYVVELDGKLEGAIIGVSNPLWYSNFKQATDLFLYTTDKGTGWGGHLLNRFIIWAKGRPGVKEIMISNTSGIDIERTKKLYERLGAKEIGATFMIEVNDG